MPQHDLAAPLSIAAGEALEQAVLHWARRSMRPCVFAADAAPQGTFLVRTGGRWDSLVAVAEHVDDRLVPLLLLKNPVPLWQTARTLDDGEVEAALWGRLSREILIHNPGLGGFLDLVGRTVRR